MKKKLKKQLKSQIPKHLKLLSVLESNWSINDNNKFYVTFEVENKQDKKPIFKLNNKFMYEGDEYWWVNTYCNWELEKMKVKKDSISDPNTDADFLTKQEALNYVLEEAKERFKGCNTINHSIFGKVSIDTNSLKIVDNNTAIGDKTYLIWDQYGGFSAEPIKETAEEKANKLGFYVGDHVWEKPPFTIERGKIAKFGYLNENLGFWNTNHGWYLIGDVTKTPPEPKLMLGNEVVEIEDKIKWNEAVIRHGVTEEYPSKKTIIHCKGESVTKEEWMHYYNRFMECKKHAEEFKIAMACGSYIIWDAKINRASIDGIITMITLEQIEAITKQLESC
jgi:hypothetical protein